MRLLLFLLAGCAAKAPTVTPYVPEPMVCGFVADSADEERRHRARHDAMEQLEAILLQDEPD